MEKSDMRKMFGAEVKRRRTELGMSQEELAERAELHRTYVSDVEAGKRNPSLASIHRLAKALGAPLSVVFGSAERFTPAVRPADECERREADILLVADDAREIEMTLKVFAQAKLANRVQVMRDGGQALDFVFGRGAFSRRRGEQPHLVLLDWHAPGVQALEVLRKLKAEPRTRSIQVVLLVSSRKGEQIAREEGADGCIIKPLNFQDFSQIVLKLSFGWVLTKSELRGLFSAGRQRT